MTTMKRIQYHQYGGPEVMRLEEVEVPMPGKGQMLVRIKAAAANPFDYKIRNGMLKLITGRHFPCGLGHDFAGIVERVGGGVTRFKVGDAVFGGMMPKSAGAFAELGVAEEKYCVKKPNGLSFEEAAALPTAGLTGIQAVVKIGKLEAGQSIFITGCLGAVGRTAAQIARMRGVFVAGSCRDTSRTEAEALGINPVVGFDFDPAPLKGRFDVVLDSAGVLPVEVARKLLKPGGRIIDIHPSLGKLVKSAFSSQYKVLIAAAKIEDFEMLARAAVEGKVRFPVARTVPLDQAIDALTELETRGTPKGGKLVVTP